MGKTIPAATAAVIILLLIGSPPAARASATATGVSRDFNPAVSVNALLLYRSGLGETTVEPDSGSEAGHDHGAAGDGFAVQETELRLTSIIDPYAKADFVFAMHGTDGFELEEGFVRLISLPRGLGLRAGKAYFEFGKHNAYHTHQFPFVERPYAWDALLGEHGLNGAVVEASWLTPLPWYAEVIAYGFPSIETVYGDHEIPENEWGGGARIRQLWEAGDRATVDLGVSYAGGDALRGGRRHFTGADLTFKWSGTGRNPRTLEIQSEWFRRMEDLESWNPHQDGFYAHALGRVTRRVVAGARIDFLRSDEFTGSEGGDVFSETNQENPDVTTFTGSLAFVPSEFQAIRLDVIHRDFGDSDEQAGRLQYNFTIGSHPAHRY
ncbi:MAG: hypothetical protein ABIK65_00295 [Candidatus Eisenbacteria bacterium]